MDLPAGVEPAVFYRQRLEGPCFSAFHCVDDLARRLAAGKAGGRFRRAAKGSGHNQGRKKGHQSTGVTPQKMSCCCCADCQLSCAWLLQILVLFCGAALRCIFGHSAVLTGAGHAAWHQLLHVSGRRLSDRLLPWSAPGREKLRPLSAFHQLFPAADPGPHQPLRRDGPAAHRPSHLELGAYQACTVPVSVRCNEEICHRKPDRPDDCRHPRRQ